MGNCHCQAAEAAAVVVQHPGPGGKVERLYWPTSAAEVMRNNPGHYVALVTLRVVESSSSSSSSSSEGGGGGGGGSSNNHKQKPVRLTRVKLLKPRDTLVLGQVYRLITSQEVTKALRHRKNDNFNHLHPPHYIPKTRPADSPNTTHHQGGTSTSTSTITSTSISTSTSTNSSTQRNRQNWRPSLHRIDEIGT